MCIYSDAFTQLKLLSLSPPLLSLSLARSLAESFSPLADGDENSLAQCRAMSIDTIVESKHHAYEQCAMCSVPCVPCAFFHFHSLSFCLLITLGRVTIDCNSAWTAEGEEEAEEEEDHFSQWTGRLAALRVYSARSKWDCVRGHSSLKKGEQKYPDLETGK